MYGHFSPSPQDTPWPVHGRGLYLRETNRQCMEVLDHYSNTEWKKKSKIIGIKVCLLSSHLMDSRLSLLPRWWQSCTLRLRLNGFQWCVGSCKEGSPPKDFVSLQKVNQTSDQNKFQVGWWSSPFHLNPATATNNLKCFSNTLSLKVFP